MAAFANCGQVLKDETYRIGIDVGGTFTKAALIDAASGTVVGRSSVHTTHDHQYGVARGVIEVFERVLTLATQLAAEGREGRPVGALFVLGDSERVLAQSRGLVLNPFLGHPESGRNVLDPALEDIHMNVEGRLS